MRDVILPELWKYLPENEIKYFSKRDNMLELKNGSIVTFKSCDSGPSKFQSAGLRWEWFDEEPPEDIWTESQARADAGFPLDTWLTMTPLAGMDWSYSEIIEKQKPGEVEVFGANMMDNHHLPPKERRRLWELFRNRPEAAARLFGGYFDLSGKIYKGLHPEIHLVEPFPIPPSWPVVRCIDPHNRKPSACNWAALNSKNEIYFFQELQDEYESLFEEFVNKVREMSSGYNMVRSLSDPSARQRNMRDGKTLQDYLSDLGISTTFANNNVSLGYDAVRSRISTPDGPKIFFFKSCPNTWWQMNHLVYEEWKFRGKDRDPKEMQRKKDDDLADNVRYICAENVVWESNPDWSPEPSNHTFTGY